MRTNQSEASPTQTADAAPLLTSLTDSSASPSSPGLSTEGRRVSFKERQRLAARAVAGGGNKAATDATATDARRLQHSSLLSTSDSLAANASVGTPERTAPGSPVSALAARTTLSPTQTGEVPVSATTSLSAVSSSNPPRSLETSGRKLSFKDRQRLAKTASSESSASAPGGVSGHLSAAAPRPSLTTTSYRQTQRNSAVAGTAPLVGPPLSLRLKTDQGVMSFGSRSDVITPPATSTTAVTATSATTASPNLSPAATARCADQQLEVTRRGTPSTPPLQTMVSTGSGTYARQPDHLRESDEAALLGAVRLASDDDEDQASIEQEYVSSRHASPPANRSNATTTSLASPHTAQPTPCPSHPEHSPLHGAPPAPASAAQDILSSSTGAALPPHQGFMHSLTASTVPTECCISPQSSFDRVDSSRSPQRREGDDERPHSDHPTSSTTHTRAAGDREDNCDFDAADEEEEALALAATQNGSLEVDGFGEPNPQPVHAHVARPMPTVSAPTILTTAIPSTPNDKKGVDFTMRNAETSPEKPATRRCAVQPSLLPAHQSSLSWDAASKPMTVSARGTGVAGSVDPHTEKEDEGRSEGETHTPSFTTPRTLKNVLSHWAEQEGFTTQLIRGDSGAHGPHVHSLSNSSLASSGSNTAAVAPPSRSPASHSGRTHTFMRVVPSDNAISALTPVGTPTVSSRRERGKMLSSTTPRLPSQGDMFAFPRSPVQSHASQRNKSPGSLLIGGGSEGLALPVTGTDAYHAFAQRIQQLAQDPLDESHFSARTCPTLVNSGEHRGWSPRHAASHTYDSVMMDELDSVVPSRTVSRPASISPHIARTPQTAVGGATAASAVSERLAHDTTANTTNHNEYNNNSFPAAAASIAASSVPSQRRTTRTAVPPQSKGSVGTGLGAYKEDSLANRQSSTPTPLSPEVLHAVDVVGVLSPYVPSRLLTLPMRTGGGGGTRASTAAGGADPDDEEADASETAGSGTLCSHTDPIGDVNRSHTELLGETGRSQTDLLGTTTGRLTNSVSLLSVGVASRTNRRTSTFSSLQFSMNRRRPHRQSSQHRQLQQKQAHHNRSASSQLFSSSGELYVSGSTSKNQSRNTRGGSQSGAATSRRPSRTDINPLGHVQTLDGVAGGGSSSDTSGGPLGNSESQLLSTTLGDASVVVHDDFSSTHRAGLGAGAEPGVVTHTIAVPSLPGPNVAMTTSLQGTEVTASAATGSGLPTKDDTDTVREVKGDSEPEQDGNPLARAEETLRAMAVDEVLPGEETVGLWSTAEVVFLPQYELLTPSETAQEMTLRALRSVTASPVSGVGGGGTPRGALIPPATPSPLPPAKVSPPLASHTTPPAALPSSVALPTSAVHVDAAGSVPGPAGASRTASPGVHRGLSLDAEGVFLFGRIASDYYVEPCDKQVREWNVSRTACPSPMEPHSLSPNLRPLTGESGKGGGDASLKATGAGSIRYALREPEDDCKIGARLLMNADSGVMLLAPHDEVEKYASKRTAAELEAEIADEEGGACACDEAFIGKDSRGMDYSRYNAHALFDHCVCCARRPASFLCVHCFVAVCPSHVSRHHRHSPHTCTLFLNLLDIMTSFDRIFWCEKCQQFTWKYTEIYDPLVDQLASTRGTYLTTASRDMRCVGYEVRFTDEPEDELVPQTFDDQDDRACSVNNHGDSHTPRVVLNEEADGAEAAPHKRAVTQTAQPTTSTRPREDKATHRNEKESEDRALQNPLSAALPDSDSVSLAGSHTPSSPSSSSSTAITVPSLVAPMQEHLVRPKPSELPGDDCVVPLGKAVRRLQGLGCSVQGWRATQEDAEAAFMIDIPALHTTDEDNSAEAVAARHARRRLRRATAETWVASGEQSPSGSPSRRRRAGRAVKSTSSSLNASPRVNAANEEEGASIAREGGKDIDADDDVDEEETIPMAVFCVFDGHGGDAVAKIAASRFETHLRAAVQNTRPDDIRARALLFYLNTESSHSQFGSPGRHRHSSATRGNRAGGGGGVDGTAPSFTGSLPTNTQEAGSLENESRHRPHHSHHTHHHGRHSLAEVAGTTRLLVPSSEGVGAMSHSGHSPAREDALPPGSPLSTVGAGPRRTTAHEKSLLPAAVASSMGGTIPVISTLSAASSSPLAPPLTTGTEKASSVRLSTSSPHVRGHSVGNPAVVVKMTEENLRRQQNHLKPVSLYGQLVDEGGPDTIISDTLVQPEQSQQGSPPFLARGAAASKGGSPSLGQAARASAPAALTLPAPASAACLSPASASAHLGFAGGENDMAMPFSPTSTSGPAPTEPLEPAPAASAMTVSEMEMLRSYFASIMEEALLSLDDAIRKTPEGYRGDYNCVGCTACIVGITSNFILCANVGDSGAAFYTPQTITPISVTHRLQGETEVNRIRAAGYNIVNDRIEGMLAVPRALGDFDFKQCGGKGPREQAVSCVPDVTIRPVPSDTERWGVIAACDGVWDTATLHQVHFALTNTPNDLEVATSAADAVLRAKELVRHHRRGPASFLHDITSPPSSRRVEVARKKSLTGEMPLGTSTLSSAIPAVRGKLPLPPADLHAPVDGGEGGAESDTEAHLGGSMVTDFGGEVWYGGIDAQLLTAAAGVLAQCVAPADNMAGIGLDNCSLIIVEYRE